MEKVHLVWLRLEGIAMTQRRGREGEGAQDVGGVTYGVTSSDNHDGS